MKKKRDKIIFGITFGCIIIFIGMLFFATRVQHQEETTVLYKEVEDSQEPEFSDTRKELEKLFEERGTENHQTNAQIFLLIKKYNYPLFEDSPKEYSFDERMDLYLTKLRKIAENKEEYDFLYNAISDSLIWNYNKYKEELSEEDCERFLAIINLCKERLKTALIWGETLEKKSEKSQEEEQEAATIKLTDVRKELEILYAERGAYSSCSQEEMNYIYDIPFFEVEPSKNSFEERYNSYLDKMEKLVEKHGELDLLEYVSDNLIWNYDDYRENLTEEQCERMLKLIKSCKK